MTWLEEACDVLVVGAGPAGMRAARAAASAGASVLVLDENAGPGGQIWREGVGAAADASVEGRAAEGRTAARAKQGFAASGVRHVPSTRVFDVGDIQSEDAGGALEGGALVALRETPAGDTVLRVRYRALVLATGARERVLPFPGWTLPGVFGAGGLQALVRAGWPVAGKRVVVAGSGPLLLAVAAHLRASGAQLAGLYEQAPATRMLGFAARTILDAGRVLQGAGYLWQTRGTSLRAGCWPVAAIGEAKLEAVRMTDGRRTWTVPCDALACGFHLVPNTELAQLLGCALRPDGAVEIDEGGCTTRAGVYCAGEPTGVGGLELAETEGTLAGAHAAAYALGQPVALSSTALRRLIREAARLRRFAAVLQRTFAPRPELAQSVTDETLVCRCEDVRFGALKRCGGWRDAKLQTRCGMGPCQGRVCGPAVQTLLGWQPASVRPPLSPVPLAALCAQFSTATEAGSLATVLNNPKES